MHLFLISTYQNDTVIFASSASLLSSSSLFSDYIYFLPNKCQNDEFLLQALLEAMLFFDFFSHPLLHHHRLPCTILISTTVPAFVFLSVSDSTICTFLVPQVVMQQQSKEAECRTQPVAEAS